VFDINGRQVIELPGEFSVDTKEVYLTRKAGGFLVTTRNPWAIFFEGIREISDDFMKGRRKQPRQDRR
jgi:virulence-associated protein VagC